MSRGRGKRDINVNGYIPRYVKPDLKWYERDGLLTYFDQLKYEEYSKDPDSYVSRVNVINFDLIHAQCCGQAPTNSKQYSQTMTNSHFEGMPSNEKDKAVSTCLRSERPDVFVEKKLTFDHFLNSSKKDNKI